MRLKYEILDFIAGPLFILLFLFAACSDGSLEPTPELLPTRQFFTTSTVIPATASPLSVDTPTPTSSLTPTTTPDVPYEKVTFTAEDGIDIAATLFGEGDTVLIFLHMGKGDTTQTSWHPFARLVAEGGFSALTVDLRGRGESGGSLQTNEMILDAQAAVGFLKERGYERIACLGASMGGTTCLRLAMDGDLVGVVVISSTQSVGGDNQISSPALAALTIPKLFIYGDKDMVIPGTMTLMHKVAAEPKILVVYDSAAHGTDLFNTPYGDDLRQQLLNFLKALP